MTSRNDISRSESGNDRHTSDTSDASGLPDLHSAGHRKPSDRIRFGLVVDRLAVGTD